MRPAPGVPPPVRPRAPQAAHSAAPEPRQGTQRLARSRLRRAQDATAGATTTRAAKAPASSPSAKAALLTWRSRSVRRGAGAHAVVSEPLCVTTRLSAPATSSSSAADTATGTRVRRSREARANPGGGGGSSGLAARSALASHAAIAATHTARSYCTAPGGRAAVHVPRHRTDMHRGTSHGCDGDARASPFCSTAGARSFVRPLAAHAQLPPALPALRSLIRLIVALLVA